MLSVVLPAYNEEKRIRLAVLSVIEAATECRLVIEIIIVDDGSTDGTADEVARLSRDFPFIRVIHHEKNLGFGTSFRDAIAVARYDRISLFPGDHAISSYTMKNLFRHYREADVLVAFFINTEVRTVFRHSLSTLFNLLYCLVFNIHVKYLQGSPVFPTQALRDLDLRTRGYGVLSEINVKLLRQGASFMEIQGYFNPDHQKSSVIRLQAVALVIREFVALFWEVRVLHPERYARKPKRVLPQIEANPQGPMAESQTFSRLNP